MQLSLDEILEQKAENAKKIGNFIDLLSEDEDDVPGVAAAGRADNRDDTRNVVAMPVQVQQNSITMSEAVEF